MTAQEANRITDEETGAYVIKTAENLSGMTYFSFYRSSRVKKPVYYKTANFEESVNTLFEQQRAIKRAKVERKAERKAGDEGRGDLKVGDILVSSGGYNMTIVTFYRITKLIGNSSIKVEILKNKIVTGDGWSGQCVPDTDSPGEEISGRFLFRNGSAKITNYKYARKWDGKPDYFNHLD